jgi:hypothetical protein
MAPDGISLSTFYVITAPNAWFGCGVPELTRGRIIDGYSWGMDSATGHLLYRSHSDGDAPSDAVRFTASTQNIGWRSGTSFWGTLDHAITADRTWTFPNKSGTMVLGSAGAAFQVAVWIDTFEISSDANFTYDGSTLGLAAAFLGVPASSQTFIWNEGGVDSDMRFEGDNKTSNFLLDASDDEVAIDGRLSLIDLTPSTITADQNDYNPESTATNRSSAWRVSSDAARTITGIANGLRGRVLLLTNVGSFGITLANQSGSSTAANRIITSTGADVVLAADASAILWYDSTTSRWRLVA